MKREWSIRTYRDGDEEGIYELFRVAFPSSPLSQHDRGVWLKWWRWMYKESPAGEGLIWLAEANGQIVAHYAVVPVLLKVGSHVEMAALSMDTMTHPDYRRQGLFQILAKEAYLDAGRRGINIIYGSPNIFSHPGLIKLGWYDVTTLKVWRKQLNWGNLIRSKIKNRFLSGFLQTVAPVAFDKILFRTHDHLPALGLTAVQIKSFDERFDKLWAGASDRYAIAIVRTMNYLNWKFNSQGRRYLILAAEKADEVRGYIAIEMLGDTKKTGIISDMIGDSEEVIRWLMSEAIRACRQADVDAILYNLIADRTYSSALKSFGFIQLSFTRGPFFCAYSGSTEISKTFLEDPKNWFVQLADND
jgi:GNAT superfamily N-acetyltransferase